MKGKTAGHAGSAAAAGNPRGFSDVEAGEGGETVPPSDGSSDTAGADNPWGNSADDGPDWTPTEADNSVSGANTLNLETTLLSIDAVDKVAAAIAARVSAVSQHAGFRGVVVADPSTIAALRLRSALAGELGALEDRVANARPAEGGSDSDGGGGDGGGGDAAAFAAVPAAAMALQGVKHAAKSIATALSVFQVTSSYSGKDKLVRSAVLVAALAKHLAASGLEAQVPHYAVMPQAGSGFVDRTLALQLKCREITLAGAGGPEVEAASQMVDVLLQALFGAGMGDGVHPEPVGRLALQLAEADIAAAALDQGYALLSAELAITGGSYRARKWILNALIGRDGLTYNGGAAVTFFLMAGDRMSALASDTIYFASGHGRFHGQATRFSPTNIPAS